MCRIVEETNAKRERERKVYGVLTDYDLSSWTKDLKNDYTKTSQQRTGTPPYMAHELLKGTTATHLYRHDLESLFYIMLLVCGCHTLGYVQGKDIDGPLQMVTREGEPPYQDWFEEKNYTTLGEHKSTFFADSKPILLPSHFEDFYEWLYSLQLQFSDGFAAATIHSNALGRRRRKSLHGIPPFDNETLGGSISYSSFIEPVLELEGELEGLVIRYHPKTIPPPTPDQDDSP